MSIKIVAEAKAPAATADTRLALAFQVEKKDYSVAPTPLAVKVRRCQVVRVCQLLVVSCQLNNRTRRLPGFTPCAALLLSASRSFWGLFVGSVVRGDDGKTPGKKSDGAGAGGERGRGRKGDAQAGKTAREEG